MEQHPLHLAFEAAFNAGDLEAVVALYDASAVLATGDGKRHVGRDAIREVFRAILASAPVMRLETVAAFQRDDGLALLHGRWILTARDGTPLREGRSIEMAHYDCDGGWIYLIDNPYTSAP